MDEKATQKQIKYLRYLNERLYRKIEREIESQLKWQTSRCRSKIELSQAKKKLASIKIDFGGLTKKEASKLIDKHQRLLIKNANALIDQMLYSKLF